LIDSYRGLEDSKLLCGPTWFMKRTNDREDEIARKKRKG
jgi:hypothetical protein